MTTTATRADNVVCSCFLVEVNYGGIALAADDKTLIRYNLPPEYHNITQISFHGQWQIHRVGFCLGDAKEWQNPSGSDDTIFVKVKSQDDPEHDILKVQAVNNSHVDVVVDEQNMNQLEAPNRREEKRIGY